MHNNDGLLVIIGFFFVAFVVARSNMDRGAKLIIMALAIGALYLLSHGGLR